MSPPAAIAVRSRSAAFRPIAVYPYARWRSKCSEGERVIEPAVDRGAPDVARFVQQVNAIEAGEDDGAYYGRDPAENTGLPYAPVSLSLWNNIGPYSMARSIARQIARPLFVSIVGCVTFLGVGAGKAKADAFTVTYEAARVESANTTALCANAGAGTCTIGVESFTGRTTDTTFTTDFGTGGKITGAYSAVQVNAADQYGGADGTGSYAVAFGPKPYSVALTSTLTTGINYFGFWLSALDAGNQVGFYKNNALLYTFLPSTLIAALGSCSGTNAYCGNPTGPFAGTNTAQQYAFVNFLDTNGTFDSVRFVENPASGGYESDNHTVGYATTASGTNLNVPEPASLAMLAFALAGLGVVRRRRVSLPS